MRPGILCCCAVLLLAGCPDDAPDTDRDRCERACQTLVNCAPQAVERKDGAKQCAWLGTSLPTVTSCTDKCAALLATETPEVRVKNVTALSCYEELSCPVFNVSDLYFLCRAPAQCRMSCDFQDEWIKAFSGGAAGANASTIAGCSYEFDWCDPLAQTGCTNGEACYYFDGCQAAGKAAVGAGCAADKDCVPGSICLPDSVETNSCRSMCASSGTPACSAPQTCTDATTLTFPRMATPPSVWICKAP
ncbi:MAG: hypothetical protein QM765_26580 [Myxococcales bacterium]